MKVLIKTINKDRRNSTDELQIVNVVRTFSLSESRADVASSNNNNFGFRTNARAIAIRCFCPPEISVPFSPTCVLYP